MTGQLGSAGSELMERVEENSGMVITIGIILLIFGVLAIASPLVAGLSIAITIGILLILGGIGQLFFASRYAIVSIFRYACNTAKTDQFLDVLKMLGPEVFLCIQVLFLYLAEILNPF